MDLKSILVLLPVLIVPWIAVYFIFFRTNKKVLGNYGKLAEKYSLNVDTTKKIGMKNHPVANGVYRNKSVKIESQVRDTLEGQNVLPHTVVTVECINNDDFSFTLLKRNKRNILRYSADSVLLDDNEFDDKFILQTNNAEKLKKIFDFNTRFKMDSVNALGFNGILVLQGNQIQYIERNLLDSDEALTRTELLLHEMCDIADVMKYN
ncbi:MAG: hypothetical protein IT280_07075 [Ignavibacteria bacterium]|nr:hypothetical protein [Ignavibacteria bacterium]